MNRHVSVREVGPRDGFQNEPEVIATGDKVRLIELLAQTGLQRLELGRPLGSHTLVAGPVDWHA